MNPLNTSSTTPARYISNLIRAGNPSTRRLASLRIGEPLQMLDSRFALAHLTALAHEQIPPQFVMEMASIFGLDIPPLVYLALHQALIEGDIPNPDYQVVSTGTYPADYDNSDRTIRIHASAVEHVIENPECAWELLAVLLHEFGHHLDNVIRQDLAPRYLGDTSGLQSDSTGEEGTRYAMHMARAGRDAQGELTLATYLEAQGSQHAINVDHGQAMRAVAERQSDIERYDQNEALSDREGFEADGSDNGLFSHERIEAGLAALGFAKDDLQAIYFGNWLRDHSQLLDPKIVRGPQQEKNFPNVLSRQALTAIVDVLAARKFHELRASDNVNYKVTEDKLGVYRPSQHIDNPKVEKPTPADPSTRDKDFEPWVEEGDPLLEVDYDTSMMAYIHRSAAVMHRELAAAMRLGYTPDGLQKLGSALHILEDFFAHSNFVELNLIALNHKEVLPWTGRADCKHHLPVVTGTFGGSDTIASLVGPIAKIMAPLETWKFIPTRPGQRSDSEKMLLILFQEHQEEWLLDTFETFLTSRDKASAIPGYNFLELYYWVISSPLRLAGNAYSTVFQGLLHLIGNSIDDIQTHRGADPHVTGSTDPSHSQLAKDHADHPLHRLAAGSAAFAIKEVAQAMLNYWRFGGDIKPTDVALSYFVHPEDTYKLDNLFLEWIQQNPEQIKRAASKTELEQLQNDIHEKAKKHFQEFATESFKAWDYLKGLKTAIGLKQSFDTQEHPGIKATANVKDYVVKG